MESTVTLNKFFSLHPFPTKKKKPEERQTWKNLINRQDINNKGKLWSPSKYSRVCSHHFKDGKPSEENPFPTENLGYDSSRKVKNISQAQKRRKLSDISVNCPTNNDPVMESSLESSGDELLNETGMSTELLDSNPHTIEQSSEAINRDHIGPPEEFEIVRSNANHERVYSDNLVYACSFIFFFMYIFNACLGLTRAVKLLSSNVVELAAKIQRLEHDKKILLKKINKLQKELNDCTCKKPLHSTLLKNDSDVKFYCGLNTLSSFEQLHDYIVPYVQRHWKGAKRTNSVCRNIITGKKRGPNRKLPSRDELLLTLMKLRLALLNFDLAKRFRISKCLSGQVITCWLRAMASVLRTMIFMPDLGTLNVTKPARFSKARNLHSIIDCSEIFIETPQDHNLQAMTWSRYKHHNTLKFLVGVAPNSYIVFISEAYTGRISDKEITNRTGYLDMLPLTVPLCVIRAF